MNKRKIGYSVVGGAAGYTAGRKAGGALGAAAGTYIGISAGHSIANGRNAKTGIRTNRPQPKRPGSRVTKKR